MRSSWSPIKVINTKVSWTSSGSNMCFASVEECMRQQGFPSIRFVWTVNEEKKEKRFAYLSLAIGYSFSHPNDLSSRALKMSSNWCLAFSFKSFIIIAIICNICATKVSQSSESSSDQSDKDLGAIFEALGMGSPSTDSSDEQENVKEIIRSLPEKSRDRSFIEMFIGNHSQIKSCLYNPFGYDDPDLGHVSLEPIHYCDPRTFRFIRAFTCCSPAPPTKNFPLLRLYKPVDGIRDANDGGIILNWRDRTEKRKLDPGHVVFLVHGWSEKLNTSVWLKNAVEAWTKSRGRQVIVVDWTGDNGNKYYFQTAANVRTVGKVIGFSIMNWNLIDRSNIVGHSCGAQVVGEAGRFVKERGSLLRECIGLDPAGPCFDGGSPDIRLTKDDCRTVIVAHSSAESTPTSIGIFDRKFGTYYKSGSCDYWVNCGKTQGEDCKDGKMYNVLAPDGAAYKDTSEDNSWCAHHMAALMYVNQVNRTCSYQSEVCSDCNQVRGDTCESSQEWGTRVYIPDSHCSPFEDSDFNVITRSTAFPYC